MKILNFLFRFIVINIFLFLNSCNSQEFDIKGDWQIISNSSIPEIMYMEIYIDDINLTTYDERMGLAPTNKYVVKNNDIILTNWTDGKEQNIGRINKLDNLLIISDGSDKLVYRRINESPNLGDLKKERVNQEDFAKAFFKRFEKWKMEREKILLGIPQN